MTDKFIPHEGVFKNKDFRGFGVRQHLNVGVYKNCDFRGVDFSKNDTIITRCDFIDCDLSGCNLTGVTAIRSTFAGCKFLDTEESNAILDNTNFSGCNLRRSAFGAKAKDCNFNRCNFRDANIHFSKAVGCTFVSAKFKRTNISGNFKMCDFTKAKFSGADIEAAFEDCNLPNAKFERCELQGGFYRSNLYQVEFKRCKTFIDFSYCSLFLVKVINCDGNLHADNCLASFMEIDKCDFRLFATFDNVMIGCHGEFEADEVQVISNNVDNLFLTKHVNIEDVHEIEY